MFIKVFSNINCTIQQQLILINYPSSIQCGHSNSQPLDHESPPVTTLTGWPKFVGVQFRQGEPWALLPFTYQPATNQQPTNQPTNQPTYTFRGFLRNASANYFGSKLAEWEEAERKKVKKPSAQILTSWLLQFYSKRRKILAKTKRLFEVMKMFVTLQQTYSFARVPFSASLCLFSFQTFTNLNTNLSQIFA